MWSSYESYGAHTMAWAPWPAAGSRAELLGLDAVVLDREVQGLLDAEISDPPRKRSTRPLRPDPQPRTAAKQ